MLTIFKTSYSYANGTFSFNKTILCKIQIYKHDILHNYEHLYLSTQFQN